jgi:hypothetical protein
MSAEHYWTRSLFLSSMVTVEGLPYADGKTVEKHIDDLVTNVLCKQHNSELSPLDTALSDLANALREMARLGQVRGQITKKKYWPSTRFVVDGPKIEKCMLKMALNCSKVLRVADKWTPPTWLPEVIFGKRDLPEGVGLALVARVGETFGEEERFYVGFARSNGVPTAITVTLRGMWRFICTWDRVVADMGTIGFEDGNYQVDEHVFFHPKRLIRDHGGRPLGISVDFDWSGQWTEARSSSVVKLRSEYKSPPRKGRSR